MSVVCVCVWRDFWLWSRMDGGKRGKRGGRLAGGRGGVCGGARVRVGACVILVCVSLLWGFAGVMRYVCIVGGAFQMRLSFKVNFLHSVFTIQGELCV